MQPRLEWLLPRPAAVALHSTFTGYAEGAAALGLRRCKQGSFDVVEIGRRTWAIAEGYIPGESSFDDPALVSHETACILNAGDRDANVRITLYFSDREPAGPYKVTVPARRTAHVRFNDLSDPQPVPRDTGYASVISSDVPVVVQHTRLDSRKAQVALLTTMAFHDEA